MIEGKGKFSNRPTKTISKTYDKFFIYVPIEVARDSGFPFKSNEVVIIKIDRAKSRLIVEKEKTS